MARIPARTAAWIAGVAVVVLVAAALARGTASAGDEVFVYKTPSCGCCTDWVDHLRANGFAVTVEDVADLDAVKARLGVPRDLASCHTATVGGYVVEGHVPAGDVRRLLGEKPDAIGLAVPGMPIGSPGMERGDEREPYAVIAFGARGRSVFATHGR
jgi:hypothetical protein